MENQDTFRKEIQQHQPTPAGQLLWQLAHDKRIFQERFSVPGASTVFEEFYKKEVYLQGSVYQPNPALIECLTKVGDWLDNPRSSTGLMMAGNPGNGKTTALRTIERLIRCSGKMDPENLDYYGKPQAAYLNVYKATELLHYTTDDREFNKLKRKSLMAIDDFGIEPVEVMTYGNIYTPIIEVLEYRYSCRLFTVLTTNLVTSSIRERYGDRIADRFNEMMTCVAFPDISFRSMRNFISP